MSSVTNFKALEKLQQPIGPGAVICLRLTDVALSRTVMAIPLSYF